MNIRDLSVRTYISLQIGNRSERAFCEVTSNNNGNIGVVDIKDDLKFMLTERDKGLIILFWLQKKDKLRFVGNTNSEFIVDSIEYEQDGRLLVLMSCSHQTGVFPRIMTDSFKETVEFI